MVSVTVPVPVSVKREIWPRSCIGLLSTGPVSIWYTRLRKPLKIDREQRRNLRFNPSSDESLHMAPHHASSEFSEERQIVSTCSPTNEFRIGVTSWHFRQSCVHLNAPLSNEIKLCLWNDAFLKPFMGSNALKEQQKQAYYD